MYHGSNAFTGRGGRRRMDRGLVPVSLVGGFGMSDWTQTSPVRFLSREFKTRSGRNPPANRGQETGTGLTGLLRAGPEPANRRAAPPTKLRISPDAPTSCRCCSGSAGRLRGARGARVVFPSLFERFPSFLSGCPQGHPP